MTQGESEQAISTAHVPAGRIWFAVLGGAAAWSLHFLGSYAIVAIGCVARWRSTTVLVGAATVLLAGVAAWSTLVAWREWRRTAGNQPWDRSLSEPPGWYSWLMTVGILMGITSVFTILVEGFGSLFLPLCGWDVR